MRATGSAHLNFTARTEGRPVCLSGLSACLVLSRHSYIVRDEIRAKVHCPSRTSTTSEHSRFGFSRSNTWETRDRAKIEGSYLEIISSLGQPQRGQRSLHLLQNSPSIRGLSFINMCSIFLIAIVAISISSCSTPSVDLLQ